jgi:predicted nucleic acid-binding protein
MIVIDASALIDAFLGNAVVAAVVARGSLHAPASVDEEVLHGLRRAWLAKALKLSQAESAIQLLRETAIVRHSVEELVWRMWEIRQNITSYDAGYVALAESLGVPLLTRDWRLAHSSGHAATIE